MKSAARILRSLLFVVSAFLPLAAAAQTLTLTNGVATYATLTNTTVTLSNRCELRVTGTNSPIAGNPPPTATRPNKIQEWILIGT